MSKENMAVTDREKRLVELVEHLVETLNQCADVPGAGLLMLRRARDAREELASMGMATNPLALAIVESVDGFYSGLCSCRVCLNARN